MNSTRECSLEDCSKKHSAKGYCALHYYRVKTTGSPGKVESNYFVKDPTSTCDIEGCEKSSKKGRSGYCLFHYRKLLKYGDPFKEAEYSYRYLNKDGYIQLNMPEHPNANVNGHVLEHVKVMSEYLGRPLVKPENVHHKNGDRSDNRLTNLELWSRSQPAGQRIVDKITWANEILEKYKDYSDPESD